MDPFKLWRDGKFHFAIASTMRAMGRPPVRVFSGREFYNRTEV